jgi:hypothetical protein
MALKASGTDGHDGQLQLVAQVFDDVEERTLP